MNVYCFTDSQTSHFVLLSVTETILRLIIISWSKWILNTYEPKVYILVKLVYFGAAYYYFIKGRRQLDLQKNPCEPNPFKQFQRPPMVLFTSTKLFKHWPDQAILIRTVSAPTHITALVTRIFTSTKGLAHMDFL